VMVVSVMIGVGVNDDVGPLVIEEDVEEVDEDGSLKNEV